ncbi:MAG: hypothetical protein M0D53_02355 [Flavobacterium sp. JAD_PAG50586_2]|nr:MAG: hypothetical protein M0D53_02355 [Flavobacterium sp. JAD_PAG50586_2]
MKIKLTQNNYKTLKMQKNYPFFETSFVEINCGFFQKKYVCENKTFDKITKQLFVLLLLGIFNLGYGQLAPEYFESGIPGTWAVTSNLATTPTNNWSPTPAGGYLATGGTFVSPALNTTTGVTAEYYMITPQFLTPSNGEIRFWTKQGSFTNRGEPIR